MRVSGKHSLQGSDLSVDDVLKIRLTDDYSAKVIGEEILDGKSNYILELTAKNPSVTYGRLKYWVRQDDFLPAKTEYYSNSGKHLKTMIYTKIREISGRVRPTRMEISSELNQGYRTILEILEADYVTENPDYFFTKMYLEKAK